MKKLTYIVILFIISAPFLDTVKAQPVSIEEADVIASKWIGQVIDQKETWGAYSEASPGIMQVFKNNDRKLGYFCNVVPEGFIVVSQRRELAPVKAYSTHGHFDPQLNEGIPGFLKVSIGRVLDTLESVLGPIEQASSAILAPLLEINYQDNWKGVENYIPGSAPKLPKPVSGKDYYQEGQVLLTTNWDQFPPYNDQCPYLGCTTTSNGRAFVGCVATAGAQIMRYWCWPPYGNGSGYNDFYDWPNMPNSITNSSPQLQIDAVAELNHEVGTAVLMNYGCEGSSAYLSNMIGVFEVIYSYSTGITLKNRSSYSAIGWFSVLKNQFNINRPVDYGIPGHNIVGDGWQEIGSPIIRQYHMNYGWIGTSRDIWYTLDAIAGGDPATESILCNINPVNSIGNSMNGSYPISANYYRYFNVDASGYDATFNAGQFLQFLPNTSVVGSGGISYFVRFYGSNSLHTHMFTNGDHSTGIFIVNGGIRLGNNGGIKFN